MSIQVEEFILPRLSKCSLVKPSIFNPLAGKYPPELLQLLEESESRYASLFEHNSAVMLQIEPESGRIADANKAACEFYGYSKEELLACKITDLNILDYKEVHQNMQKAVQKKERRFQFRHRLANGEIRDVEVFSGPIYAQGKMLLYSIIYDITAKIEAEQKAQRQEAELAHAGRLNMLGEMASGLAHELNQPLTAIGNLAQACKYLLGNPLVQNDLEKALEEINLQCQRAGQIIRRMRQFIRKKPSDCKAVPLINLLRSSFEFMEEELSGRKICLKFFEPADPIFVWVDEIQIQQVIMNLLRNAMEALHGVPKPRREIRVEIHRREQEVGISISDQGKGIDPEHQEHMFESFFTTKAQGLGLGLPLSRAIIQAHGGQLWGESNRDHGAQFEFTLPLYLK